LAFEDREEDLDQVEPGRVGRGEVRLDPWVLGQPGLDLGVGVGGVVVQHHMQVSARVGAGDELEEGQEPAMSVARPAGVGDAAGGDLQGGEQRGAVAEVVVGVPLGPAGRTGREGWVRSSAWICDFSSTHSRIACAGGFRESPTTSRTLTSSSGSVENLNVWICQGLRSCSAHARATVLWLIPSSVARSRLDQWVTPGPGAVAEGGGQDLSAPVAAHGLGAAPAGPVGQACGESLTRIAFAPGDHGGSGDLQPLGDLAVGHALGGQQQELGPPDQGGRARAAFAQRRRTAWSWALTGRRTRACCG
jgi:hypothetical protein